MDPIAVVGFSFRMPQEAVDEPSFWNVLENRRNLMTAWPESRATIDSFHDGGSGKVNTLHTRGAHFVDEDPAVFDAPFFSITAKEATAMDPQQRWVLETAYHAFENAGIPVDSLRGSRTGVFGCTMSDDYSRMLSKDPDRVPRMAAIGIAPSILSNRVSWYFHLRGPSMQIETACSSSMIALDQACQAIRNGDATAALVFGCNALLSPESSLFLSNMNFLSPDSLCYSFDHRANGYSRGEGVVAVVIKPLSHAVRDGDVIRAVIRATGSNQDGRTPTMTQPSVEAQEMLIRQVYQKAGLGFDDTRYLEAHGTGTPTGDPIEMKAIGRVFRTHRSPEAPLYVGSVKSNLGHLEGASGLAGLVKTILALEKGAIPPQALFEKMNPDIDADFYHVVVPTDKVVWPTKGLRRASVNSFGFGGSNAHAILDDALHYLQSRGLVGHHNCTMFSSLPGSPAVNGTTYSTEEKQQKHQQQERETLVPRLLVWTAADADAIDRVVDSYRPYYRARISRQPRRLDQLAYTLAARRTHMPWRCFSVVDAADVDEDVPVLVPTEKPVRASNGKLGIAFVFTGQGAQYAGMGLQLLRYPVFAETLRRVDAVLADLGCRWSLLDALSDQERIDRPEYSQPLCTGLQLALVELLRSMSIAPAAVVGHSSGEIAAAYATGALSLESACRVAYYRGQAVGTLKTATSAAPGAMMSVNLAESEVPAYLSRIEAVGHDLVHTACVNSPLNCTLSGPASVIDEVKKQLDADGVFAQKLSTGVAYHSPAMESIAAEYLGLLGAGLQADAGRGRAVMISSVTGRTVAPKLLASAQYWVDNLVSPVRFADALQGLAKGTWLRMGKENVTDIVEVGPHAALRRPVLDTLAELTTAAAGAQGETKLRYHAVLQRSRSPQSTALELLGTLFCRGYPVSVAAGNGHDQGAAPPPLVDCPKYPFDHSRRYWIESRLSRDFRLRGRPVGHLVGKPASDWNPLQPCFRNWLSVESIPWLADHVISNTTISPGAGSMVMAIEAVRFLSAGRLPIYGFLVKEAHFLQPIPVAQEAQAATELSISVRPMLNSSEKESTLFEVRVFANRKEQWTECFRADVQTQYEETTEKQVDRGLERRLEGERIVELTEQAAAACGSAINSEEFYDFLRKHGLDYGPAFSLLRDVRWDEQDRSVARIEASPSLHQAGDSPVHPAVLDAAVHLILAQVSQGMSGPMPTLVPQRLSNAWISARAWADSGASVRVTSVVKENTSLGVSGSLYALADDGSALCAIEDMAMVPVSHNAASEEEGRNLLYKIEWKAHLGTLGSGELQELCNEQALTAEGQNGAQDSSVFRKLDAAISKAATHAVRAISEAKVDVSRLPDHLQKFAAMLRDRYGDGEGGSSSSSQQIETLLQECETANPSWALFTKVGRNLEAILRGETDPLDMLFADQDTSTFYASVFDDLCDARFRAFLDLASHQKPDLRIIEVGAGTGGMTRHLLAALLGFEQRTGSCRFSEYTYTDLSPAFFEQARKDFAHVSDRLVFRRYDVEREPGDEGLELGGYDMVIAGSVLHATADLVASMRHLRALLRPGGHVAFLEITAPDSTWANVGFGSLPGWWRASEEWRQQGPLVTEECWRRVARETGFSGLDLCLRYDNCVELMVATAEEMCGGNTAQLVLVVQGGRDTQREVAGLMEKRRRKGEVQVIDLDDVRREAWSVDEDVVVVSLLDVGGPFLATMCEGDFEALQRLVQRTHKMLWVTAPEADESEAGPHLAVATGFLRTMRSEEPSKQIVRLSVESGKEGEAWTADKYAGYVERIVERCFAENKTTQDQNQNQRAACRETEFVVQNGHLQVGRVAHEAHLDEDRRQRVKAGVRMEAWGQEGPGLKLSVGRPGMLDTLRFEEDGQRGAELGDDEVEIEAKAWPLSFRDLFIALGRLSEQQLGYECAGIVTRVGAAVRELRAGDRVCLFALGSMRAFPRAKAADVCRIADSVSLEEAAAAMTPGMTAYQALVSVARVRQGETVLIHSATGGTGQMAVWMAKHAGAEVFATVGSDEKKRLLETLGVAGDHIFYSRNTSFARGIKRMTGGRGVDVVLNSLSGDGLRASWECVAPYGRFIEVGKMDIAANAALPMGGFARNVSFCAVDLHHIIQTDPELTRQLIRNVMDMLGVGTARTPWPLHPYSVEEVEGAFRYMQSGKNTGRIVLTARNEDVVRTFTVKKSSWRLRGDASYLIAGGFGGLGRAILRWMADKGARTLLVPSRSGPTSPAAAEVVTELRGRGVTVLAAPCDVGSAEELARFLRGCVDAGAPRVRGCINSAMCLQDAVYEGMTHAQWEKTLRSKVGSSWNLHCQLPDLDFFIMLASLSGVYGSLAQSNYAAGCTFQDALARHRASSSSSTSVSPPTSAPTCTSVSLDLGWMRDIGIVSERQDYRRNRDNARDMNPVDGADLLALLDHYCDPTLPALHPDDSQLLVGAVTPLDVHTASTASSSSSSSSSSSFPSASASAAIAALPLFAGFAAAAALGSKMKPARESEVEDDAVLFRQVTGKRERARVVVAALVRRLARALSVAPGDVDTRRPLSDYGVDSLMAVELRNWIRRDFDAGVAVFDIMGGSVSIEAVGELVVERARE